MPSRLVLVLYDHDDGVDADHARDCGARVLPEQPCGVLHAHLMAPREWADMQKMALRACQLAQATQRPVMLLWRMTSLTQADRLRHSILAYADVCIQVLRASSGSPVETRLVKHPTLPTVPIDLEHHLYYRPEEPQDGGSDCDGV